jgi:hypothetical protein
MQLNRVMHTGPENMLVALIPWSVDAGCVGAFLYCRRCTFARDSLEPLAQLRSLRQLFLDLSSIMRKHGTKPVVGLLASAVRGCLLKIQDTDYTAEHLEAELISARDALVAERGSRNVPAVWLS